VKGRVPGRAVLVCALLAISSGLVAQPAGVSGSKYYVWGQVRSPGAYSFIASPDIVELLSAGGGPTENANLRRVTLIQAMTQKRTRIDLQRMMDSGQVLRLAPGDVVIVPSSPWSYVRDGLVVLTSAASLVTVVLTIMNWAAR
jgi:protein involved in polysaccharide export with SLBB domain